MNNDKGHYHALQCIVMAAVYRTSLIRSSIFPTVKKTEREEDDDDEDD